MTHTADFSFVAYVTLDRSSPSNRRSRFVPYKYVRYSIGFIRIFLNSLLSNRHERDSHLGMICGVEWDNPSYFPYELGIICRSLETRQIQSKFKAHADFFKVKTLKNRKT